MKKLLVFLTSVIMSAIVITMLTRASARSSAIVFEWFVLVLCVIVLILFSWYGARYFLKTKTEVRKERAAIDRKAVLDFGISKRELEVLQLVADGLSNKQIAEKLFLSESTVKKHVSNIYSKLNAGRRTDAIRIAYEFKLLKTPVNT